MYINKDKKFVSMVLSTKCEGKHRVKIRMLIIDESRGNTWLLTYFFRLIKIILLIILKK